MSERWVFVPEKLHEGMHVAGRTAEIAKDGKIIAKVLNEADGRFIVKACNDRESYIADDQYRKKLQREADARRMAK